jgi:hypothetical protein
MLLTTCVLLQDIMQDNLTTDVSSFYHLQLLHKWLMGILCGTSYGDSKAR